MSYIVEFTQAGPTDVSAVGAKGFTLGLMAQAGLPVPPGFTLTTGAYNHFLRSNKLEHRIKALLDQIDFENHESVETLSLAIQDLVLSAKLPLDLLHLNTQAFKTTNSAFVAVRSSGTAEDLADASFAGLHDTLLDVTAESLLDSIKQCWASLFSARAIDYRNKNGFDHLQASIAVVVQAMVPANAAGVCFTANPLTGATDECVVNSSYGLGEAVVSGLVTPDSFTIKAEYMRIRERTLGSKHFKIQRTSKQGEDGTSKLEVHLDDQTRFSLSDENVYQLVHLSLRVQSLLGGFPQDIEWAIHDDQLYLLQSRPITGVDFSWDSDVEDWQKTPEKDDVLWTRALADEAWNGAVSPLFYSVRALSWHAGYETNNPMWGFEAIKGHRWFKYYKGVPYYNCELEKAILEHTTPPLWRGGLLARVPPSWHQAITDKAFDWSAYLRMIAAIEEQRPQLFSGFETINDKWKQRFDGEGRGLPQRELKALSDEELHAYCERMVQIECDWGHDTWSFWFIYVPNLVSFLGWMCAEWLGSDDPTAFQCLLTGSTHQTQTIKQNHDLWKLSMQIRQSASLLEAFQKHQRVAFFEACSGFPEGQTFLRDYADFVRVYGQRGMPDRDMSFKRRVDDPSIDYQAFALFLASDDITDPDIKEEEVNQVREEAFTRSMATLRSKPFGTIKAEIFKVVFDWCMKFVCTRDDQRHWVDCLTLAWRHMYLEVGRRLTERGVFNEPDDVWWLVRKELYPVLLGAPLTPLLRAKMSGRKRNFEKRLGNLAELPLFIKNGAPLDVQGCDSTSETNSDRLHGVSISRGVITAKACVVQQYKDIGRVPQGCILVTNSTDPGWTPVFSRISGLVLETGGVLSHGACLAREHGLPALQVLSAAKKIPDGQLITLDADHGRVTFVEADHLD